MKKLGLILLSLLLIGGLIAQEKPVKCPKKVPVLTEKLAGQEFVEHVTFTGKLQSETVLLSAKVDGVVSAVMVGEGDLVSQGFQLLELNEGLKGEISAFEKELELWNRRLSARRNWKERSQRAEAQAEENIKRVEEKLAELKQQAMDSFIYAAPLAGRVVNLKVAVQQQVKSGEPLLSVVNAQRKIAVITMSEEMASLFGEDRFELVAGERRFQAEKLGYRDGSMALAVADGENAIADGSDFSLTLVKKTHRDAVVVAESVVVKDGDKDCVYVLEGGLSRLRQVVILAREESKALVSQGLALGEEIVVAEIADAKKSEIKSAFACLKDGGSVRVMVRDEQKNRLVKRPKDAKAKDHQALAQDLPKEEPQAEEKPVKEEVKKEKIKKEKKASVDGEPKALRFAIGLRGGLYSSSYSYDLPASVSYSIEPKSKQTAVFAGMFEYAVTRDISVGAEVASLSKNSTFQLQAGGQSYDLEVEKKYLDLTFYGKYHLPLRIDKAGNLRPFVLLGFFYGQKSEGTYQYVYNGEILTEEDADETWGKVDSGLVAGLGFEYNISPSFSLLLDGRYEIGARDQKGNQYNETVKIKGLQLSLGGLFRF